MTALTERFAQPKSNSQELTVKQRYKSIKVVNLVDNILQRLQKIWFLNSLV